jgi:hypothetical protein
MMKRTIYFCLIPLALFVIGVFYIESTGPFFLRSVDPEYAYLFNGLLLAHFKFDVGFVTNPGTPLQCIVALVLRDLHLFRPGQSLMNDVLQNPEIYIKAILYTVNTINALASFILGYFTYKYTQNIIIALFLQLTPFSHVLTIEVLARMIPESLMNILVCFWLLVIIKMLFQNDDKRNYQKYSLVFGILFGISLADKLTFLPFFLLPLIILPSWRLKLKYIFSSLFFFLLFAIPVTLNHKIFIRWVKDIFIHTGSYGSGDTGIIKWNEFIHNLSLQISNTHLLIYILILFIVVSFIYFIRIKMKRQSIDLTIRIIFGIISIIFLEYFMTAKHFAYHYMIPSILLTVFMILMIGILLNHIIPFFFTEKIMNLALGITGILILTLFAPKSIKQLKQIQDISEFKAAGYSGIAPLFKASPRIISASYYGCSAKEYALIFGLHVSGKYGHYLYESIEKLYPSIYFYFPWSKVFYEGNKEISPSAFVKKGTAYDLYIADYSKERLEELIVELTRDYPQNCFIFNKIYVDSIHSEALFQVQFRPPQLKPENN